MNRSNYITTLVIVNTFLAITFIGSANCMQSNTIKWGDKPEWDKMPMHEIQKKFPANKEEFREYHQMRIEREDDEIIEQLKKLKQIKKNIAWYDKMIALEAIVIIGFFFEECHRHKRKDLMWKVPLVTSIIGFASYKAYYYFYGYPKVKDDAQFDKMCDDILSDHEKEQQNKN